MSERPDKVTTKFGTLGNVNVKERTFEAWSSVADVDRDKEYVPISAFVELLSLYKDNPVLLLGHQHKTISYESLPIGKCLEIEPRDEGLWTKFYISKRPLGNEVLTLLDEGILRGLSAGFIPVKFIPNPSDHELPTYLRGKGIRKYYQQVELVEISLLSIPSNRKSLVIHAQKGNRVADMVMKEFRGEDVTYVIKEWLSEEKAVDPYKKHLWLGFTLQPEARTTLGNVDVEGKKVAEEELHLTLRYFGDVENMGDVDDVRDALLGLENTLATTYELKPVDYEIFKDNSLVARYSNGAISELHEKVNNLLKSNTLNFPEEFPHLDSHVTLAMGEGLTPPVEKPPSAQTGELRLMWGKDEVIHNFTPHQIAWNTFVSKVFGWNESEHPRSDNGEFSSKIGDINFETERNPLPSRPWFFSGQDPKHEEINNKLDNIIGGQRGIATNVEAIKNQDSWGNWAKKWVVRIGILAGAYYGIKHIAKSPEARQKVVGWLKDSGLKEFKGEDATDKLLHVLDLTKAALTKGKSLGATNTPEYKKLESFYNKAVTSLKNVGKTSNVEVKTNKGLSQLWVVTKEMTPETSKEDATLRNVHGRYRNKPDTSGQKKVKVEHADEEVTVAKDWTAEDEREHPRAPEGSSRGGEFVSKNEPTSESGAWGGVRKNAGRTSKNPIIARQRLEERFKQENPGITDDKLKQKMIEHAVEKKNPDLYLHLTDPGAYQKKREQEIVEAMASKPSRNKVRGQAIEKIDDPAGTSVVLNDIKTTRAAWNRELTQAKDVHEAWKTFHEKDPEELDLARAKLITAAASVATLVGLGVLLAKRPNLRSAGFKFLPGAESGSALPMDAKTGLVDFFVRDHPTWVRFFKNLGIEGEHSAKAAGMGDVVYDREIGALRKWAAKKLNVKDPKTGELLYPFAGPKLTGYGPGSRYGIKDYHTINGMSSNYVPTPGDANEYGDILVTQLREKIAREGKATAAEQVGWDYVNLAIALKRLPKNPREWRGPHPPGLRIATDEKGKAYWTYKGGVSSREGISQRLAAEPKVSPSGNIDTDKAAAKAKLVTGESIFKKYLAGDIKGGGKFNRMSNEAILDKNTLLPIRKPSKVLRPIPDEAKTAFNAKAEAYKSNAHAFTKNILPQLSGRALGMLTVTSGVAGVAGAAEGIYYFQQDIERYLSGYFKHKEEQAKAAAVETPGSKQTEAERVKAQMALLKQQQKLAEAQGNAAERKTILEDRRAKLRQELVDMGVRRYAEGAVPMWAANPETFFRRLHDTGMLENESDIRRVSEIMLGEDRRKAARLIEELDGMPLTRNRGWWKKWDQQTWDEKAKGTFWEQEGYTESDYHKAQREARENAKKAKAEGEAGTKGASGLDLIIKMFEPSETTPLAITFKAIEIKEDEPFNEEKFQDDAITALAEHIARMISDISQSCKTVIRAGMPGMSEYVELNNIVTEIYAYLKDVVKNSPQEVSQKGFENVMSSQVDAGGGLFAEPRRCRICGQTVTEGLILKCKKAGCPFSFLEKIENKD
jgi:HK97 family phage prohead protease